MHLRGYERLRIAPSVAPTGLHWRCGLADAGSVQVEHGARLCSGSRAVLYTSGYGSDYFGWGDMSAFSPRELAQEIERRLPELMEASRGADPAYVAWYEAMLAVGPEHLPHASADWDVPDDCVMATAPWANLPAIRLPLPPAGQCTPCGA